MKYYDPNNKRWEVPLVSKLNTPTSVPDAMNYDFRFTSSPFGFSVTRKSSGEVLYNSTSTNYIPETQFSGKDTLFCYFFHFFFVTKKKNIDQYLTISTSVPLNPNIYG